MVPVVASATIELNRWRKQKVGRNQVHCVVFPPSIVYIAHIQKAVGETMSAEKLGTSLFSLMLGVVTIKPR